MGIVFMEDLGITRWVAMAGSGLGLGSGRENEGAAEGSVVAGALVGSTPRSALGVTEITGARFSLDMI